MDKYVCKYLYIMYNVFALASSQLNQSLYVAGYRDFAWLY